MHKGGTALTNSKYDEYFEIRMARKEDIPMIMKFIHDHWKKDHILATNRSFFEYEFLDGEEVHCVLAIRKDNQTLAGYVGYIAYCQTDVAGAMIKVLNDLPMPMLGLELIRRREQLSGYQRLVTVGVNPNTLMPALKKIFKRQMGIMKHGYMLADKKQYQVAVINEKKIAKRPVITAIYHEINGIEEYKKAMDTEKRWEKLPYKPSQYLNKRYFHHPIYNYRKFLLQTKTGTAFLVVREVEQNQSRILRIVDFVGDVTQFEMVGSFAFEMLTTQNYEYIDFMVGGIETEELTAAGFQVLKPDDTNIIPNYFEPFVQKNIEVWYEATEDLIVFRADGDGDRPSIS